MSINQRLCPLRFLDQNLGLRIDPQDLLLPYYDFHKKNVYTPWFSSDISKVSESTMKDDKDSLKINIDVQHFKPNELNVKVSDKEIVIEGSHEERQDEHGFISRKFSRRCILPINCPPENVTSTLSSDGILTVIATKKCIIDDSCREKIVPIKFCGACPYKEKVNIKSNITHTNNKDIDTIKIEDNVDRNKSQIMLKEDHSCLLKPELLAEAGGSKEKIIDKTKQMDDLFKTSEKLTQESSRIASEIIEGAFGQTSKSKGDMETFGQCSILATEEKSKLKEVSEFQETFRSSSKSYETKTAETKSEYLSDVISAELKEATENI